MDLMRVEKVVEEIIKDRDLSIYEIKFVKEFGYQILQIALDRKTPIAIEELAEINELVSDKLDDVLADYMLEVCSAGAEKELRCVKDIIDSIGKYITVITNGQSYVGYLIAFDNQVITLQINLKGRLKKINIDYQKVDKIHLSVKF